MSIHFSSQLRAQPNQFSYAQNYHPLCPLVPRHVLEPADIWAIARYEPFLLTAILTIASKGDPNIERIHQHCWDPLKKHMLDVLMAVPSTLNVGSVEGLLLLAEWVQYPLSSATTSNHAMFNQNISVVEDNMAWSLTGQAIRHAYLLRLDRASSREKLPGVSQDTQNRNRLAWTCTSGFPTPLCRELIQQRQLSI